MILTAIRLPNDARAPRCFCGARTPCALSSQRRMSAKKLLWGAHAVRAVFPTTNERKEASVGRARRARCLPNDERAQGVFPTTNERKEARAAREPHNNSVSDEHLWSARSARAAFAARKSARKFLWSARSARAVFPTTNERDEHLCSARSARAVFPTTNERKEARAAREPHNNSVRDEHLWSAHAVRAVFPTTNERLLMLHRCLCLGRIRRCLCVGSKARRPAPAGRSAVSLRAASAVSPRPASARGRWWGSMMRTTKQG